MSLTALYYLLTETSLTPKHDLRKKKSFAEKAEEVLRKYFYLFCAVAILFCIFMFVIVCFWICGVSAVESGTYYNQFQGVI